MSMVRTARRRRKQAAQNYNHLSRQQRPYYHRRALLTIQDAINREREQARRAAQIKRKK